jgi:hypothetical protein
MEYLELELLSSSLLGLCSDKGQISQQLLGAATIVFVSMSSLWILDRIAAFVGFKQSLISVQPKGFETTTEEFVSWLCLVQAKSSLSTLQTTFRMKFIAKLEYFHHKALN